MTARTSSRWPLLCAFAAVLVYARFLGSGFQLVNLLLHASVATLAWFNLKRAGTHYGTALLGGVVFAVLPVHTEAVASLAGRSELLAGLFVLSAWLAHGRSAEGGPAAGRWGILAALLYFAAVRSSVSAVLAPVLFVADDALRRPGAPARRAVVVAGYAAALTAALVWPALGLGAHTAAQATPPLDNPAAAAGAWPRVATALWLQLRYALLCIAPRHLVSDYSFDAVPTLRSLVDPRVLAGFVFAASLVATAAWGWKRSRPVALAVLIWILFFLPSANMLFPTGTMMAERLAYLPSLGVCLAIGHLGAAVAALPGQDAAKRARRIAVVALSAVIVTGFAARAWARLPDWDSDLSLALADVATSPRSAKLQARAGTLLAEVGRIVEAEDHLRRAVEIFPEYARAHYDLAVVLARRDAREEAAEHLRRAIELAPGDPRPSRLLEQLDRR